MMPVKNDEKFDGGSTEAVNKSKKTRYSLKKLLDRSRFSPRLLRIPRLIKTTDVDQELDAEVKTSCFNMDGDSVAGSGNQRGPPESGLPFARQLASSVPLDSSKHLQTANSTSGPDNTTPENPVEEDYEESLTQFADLIIDGFKNSSSLRVKQPVEPHSQASLIGCTDPQNSNAPLWLPLHGARFAHPVNEQLTPPLKFDPIHRLSSAPSLQHTESCAIYNEPCDAKPSPGHNPDDPVTIYTVSGFPTESADNSNHCSSKGSLHSSHSSVTDAETRALPVPTKVPAHSSAQDPSESSGNSRAADRCSPGASPDQASGASSHDRSSTPCAVSSTSPTPPQSQLGFVDGPRGNSVIVHHPTSPFARVPRGSVPTISSFVSATNGHGKARHNSVIPFAKLLPSSVDSREPRPTGSARPGASVACTPTPSTQWKNDAAGFQSPVHDSSHRLRTNANDSHPTYEEAWDLKMARQLGFGISRLTPVPAIASSSAPVPHTGSSELSTLAIAPCPKTRQPVVTQVPAQPNPVVANATKSRTRSSKAAHPSGLIFHENRIFDQPSNALKSKSDSVSPQPASTPTEYDYAYNGSWSMGVKLNLSLAINGASETCDSSLVTACPTSVSGTPSATTAATTATTDAPSTGTNGPPNSNPHNRLKTTGLPPPISLVPPQVPAHQNQRLPNVPNAAYRTDRSRAKQPVDSGFAANEFDTGSTDSYDESWEARHGRVVSELTNARFVDPSALVLTEPVSTGSSVHSVGQPLSVLTNTVATSDPHQRSGYHGDGQHHLGTSPAPISLTTPVTPTGTGVSPGISVKTIPPNMELLPLEEQPWFHRSLTRSEAEDLLRNQPEGSFLVRNSQTCPNDYSLTIKHKSFLHMKISRNAAGQYILGEYSQPYATVPQMIYHYARTLVPVRGAESVTLVHPVCTRNP